MNRAIACALIALLACPSTAGAVLINYGTAEAVSIRTCFAGPTSACDSTSAGSFVFGGAPGATSSAATINIAGQGSANGFVTLSGFAGEPALGAHATSNTGFRASTNSVGLQRYTYVGNAPTTRTWAGILSYSQTLAAAYPPPIFNGVFAALDVFTLSVPTIEVGTTAQSNFLTLADPNSLPGYHELAYKEFSDQTTNPFGAGAIGVTVTLNPLDTVWVWGILQTPATNGSDVNAAHTFTTAWDDPTNLIPAALAIPEPTTLALLALGLGGIGLARRRTRS